MTPRSLKRHEKKKARAEAKAKRDAERAKAKAERDATKAAMKGLDGKARDELRRKMAEDADKKRKEAQMQRQIDRAAEAAMTNPSGAKVELSADVIAFQKKRKLEEERRRVEEAEAAEEARLAAEADARITCAHQENDRVSSQVRIQISRSGTQWGRWHSRYVSLGYRELRVYQRYADRKPKLKFRIPVGSVCRYIPVLKSNGGIVENPDKVGAVLTLSIEKAEGLRNADGVFGKSDPFVEVRFNGKLIAATPVIDNTLAPVWNFTVDVNIDPSELSGKDGVGGGSWRSSELWFDVFDHDDDSSPDFLGRRIFAGDELTKLLHHSQEPVTNSLENRKGARVGLMGDERKAKGTITVAASLQAVAVADRSRVLEFGLREIKGRGEGDANSSAKSKKKKKQDEDNDPLGMRIKKSNKKRKRKNKKRDPDTGEIIPETIPLTGFDRRGIGHTPARHAGTESLDKTPQQRKRERDATVNAVTKIRLQLPSIEMARKWIYRLIEFFPNVVTYLHSTREEKSDDAVREGEGEGGDDAADNEAEDEEDEEEEGKDDEEEKKAEQGEKEETEEKEGREPADEKDDDASATATADMKEKEKETEKKKKKKKRKKRTPDATAQRKARNADQLRLEVDMKKLFTEVSTADGQGVRASFFSLFHMVLGQGHRSQRQGSSLGSGAPLPLLSDAARSTMREWPALQNMLKPKTYRKALRKLAGTKSWGGIHRKTFKWEDIVEFSGLADKASRRKMQDRDSTRKEEISSNAELMRRRRAAAAVARKRREERERKEAERKRRRRAQEKRQADRNKNVRDREAVLQAEREAEMGVPHEHLCISVTGEEAPYCPVCRQLAWQNAQQKWVDNEKKRREVFERETQIRRNQEDVDRKEARKAIRDAQAEQKMMRRKAWEEANGVYDMLDNNGGGAASAAAPAAPTAPLASPKTLKKKEKRRRKVYMEHDFAVIEKESARRDQWNKADEQHRAKEQFLRPVENAAVRKHVYHRMNFLKAVTCFRDRTRIARLLWQRLLDPAASFSTGDMRHQVWDESFEDFRVCHFLACKSKPAADLVHNRALTLKLLTQSCTDLVRVRESYFQPGEGAAGYGFCSLVMLDYVGSQNGVNNLKNCMKRLRSPIAEMTALRWGRAAARGLASMHAAGLIHGAVKPSNMFLNEEGRAFLGDYPFPRGTKPQPLMSAADFSSDVFAWGQLLYYIVTGGAILEADEFGDCAIPRDHMLRMVPVRFEGTIRDVLSRAIYDRETTTMATITTILHKKVRELEIIGEMRENRTRLLDNALGCIDDENDGLVKKSQLIRACAHNSTVRSILAQDEQLALLIENTDSVGHFIEKIVPRRIGEGANVESHMKWVDAEDILKLADQLMTTKRRGEEEETRIRQEEVRIAEMEKELAEKSRRRL